MKKPVVRALSILLIFTVLLSTLAASAFAFSVNLKELAQKEDENLGGNYEVQDVISLIEPRYHTIRIPVADMTLEELRQYDVDDITLRLDRDSERPYLDTTLYPSQNAGGDMRDASIWLTQLDDDVPFFTDFSVTADEENGTAILLVTFFSNFYFYDPSDLSVPNSIGGSYLNLCGWFRLTAQLGDSILGSADLKITPYESFHTMSEIYTDIDNIVELATQNGLYAVRESMGTSSAGRDMPYIIISDSARSVSDWLAFTEEAENRPTQTLADLEAGVYDNLRVPVLYSNIHASEVAAADGIMKFAELLAQTGMDGTLSYNMLTDFTEAGRTELQKEWNDPTVCANITGYAGVTGYGIAVPDLVKDTATYLGFLRNGNEQSGRVPLDTFYEQETKTVSMRELLGGVFFILVPEESVDGRVYMARTSANGYDLNRDNTFQTTPETANMNRMIGTYNPVCFTEYHGRKTNFQCEPCSPPHEPNFEYDLLAEHLVAAGEALGIGAVANNPSYHSYAMPQRDFLFYTDKAKTKTKWVYPWDDMSTSYTPQFSMLHGCVAYTVELPAYNDDVVTAVCYGSLSQADYVKEEKLGFLMDQVKIYERGVKNANSDAYELVGQWFCNQSDVEGAEMHIMRPEYTGEGENGNFYPECYLIPLDRENQCNLQAARDTMIWMSRNDVKVNLTTAPIAYDGITYPAGTLVIPMYQAKRSVANSALYGGTLLQSWPIVYSENVTAFHKIYGFDMATVTKPAAYEQIMQLAGECMDYDEVLSYADSITSSFRGEAGRDVIIRNDSSDAAAAVNALLQEGRKVGMIVDGERKGDFICSYADYLTVADRYLLLATGVAARSEGIHAQCIKTNPTVYITGVPDDNPYSCITLFQLYNTNWNYDRVAMENMNFNMTEILSEADVIAGSSELTKAESAAILNGTPYIGYGSTIYYNNGFKAINSAIGGATRTALPGAMDCLCYVTYPSNTLVNASYIAGGDDMLYGYAYEDGYYGYFSKIPAGAVPLVAVDGSRTPIQGFIPTSSAYRTFLNGGILGYSFDNAKLHLAIFANTLTYKAHQKDEYTYISNFIFSSLLTDEAYVGTCAHQLETERIPATCLEGGYSVYTCTICGYEYTADETPALGHSYVDGVCIRCAEPEPVRLLLGAATGKAGDTVTVSLSVKNNPGLASFQPIPLYDADQLELIEMVYLSETAVQNGVIANLRFRIKEDCILGAIAVSLEEMPDVAISDGQIHVVDYIPGDLDSDNEITVRDLALLRRYLANGTAFPANQDAADLDGIPGINEEDVAYLRRFLAYWEGYVPSYKLAAAETFPT